MILEFLFTSALSAAQLTSPVCDVEAARQEIVSAHKTIIDAHKEGNVDAWLSVEDDVLALGGRGRIYSQTREERRQQRTAYLARSDFEIYEDMIEPVAEVSDDCSLGWVMVQVRAKGVSTTADGTDMIDWQSSWVELYRNTEFGWRLQGAVSNFAPETQ